MKELELYIHIPFCIRKCDYCDFLSCAAGIEEHQRYVDALLKEIAAAGRQLEDQYLISSVFIGGGTPSILSSSQLEAVMSALKSSFCISEDAEITIEMNPGTADMEKIRAMRRSGINRLSIGLQSADDGELKRLGRIHSWQDFSLAYQLARDAGFDNINIDLISAIPGQTEDGWKQTLRKVLDLSPEHISAYSLIIEEGTPYYERFAGGENQSGEFTLPDEETERRMYSVTQALLGQYGYNRYEVSNYALKGRECQHNIGYWKRKEYLGLGIGAASLVGNERFSNLRDRVRYEELFEQCGEDGADMILDQIRAEKEILTIPDQIEETMMLGLRMTEGVSEEEFYHAYGKTLSEVYPEVLQKYYRYGFLKNENGRVCLTEDGISVSNVILADFLF